MLETSIHCLDNHKTSIVLHQQRVDLLQNKINQLEFRIACKDGFPRSDDIKDSLENEKQECFNSIDIAISAAEVEYYLFNALIEGVQIADIMDKIKLEYIKKVSEIAISSIRTHIPASVEKILTKQGVNENNSSDLCA